MSGERAPVLLIVDDEERILSALRRALRKEGYEILTADDPRAALALLEAREIDAVLSDHKMPEMGGLELMEHVASAQPGAARLLITGWPEEVDPEHARALGLGAVIPKPWDDADLKATLRKVLGPS